MGLKKSLFVNFEKLRLMQEGLSWKILFWFYLHRCQNVLGYQKGHEEMQPVVI